MKSNDYINKKLALSNNLNSKAKVMFMALVFKNFKSDSQKINI